MPEGGVSWKEYVDTRLTNVQNAVDKAEVQLRERLAGMNEFRDALKDQASRFTTRDMVDQIVSQLQRQLEDQSRCIRALEQEQANAAGRSWMLWAILGAGLTILSIALRFLVP